MNPGHVYLPWLKSSIVAPIFMVAVACAVSLAGAHPPASAHQNQPSAPAPGPRSDPLTHCVPDWGLSPSPDVGNDRNQMMGVAVVSSVDVWAVGTYMGWPYRPIIEHWNGDAWTIMPGPDLDGAGALWGVSAVSRTDVWAVGYYDTGNRRWRPLLLHWNGTSWSQATAPDTGTGSSYLFGVTAISSTDVWAVGSSCCIAYQPQTLSLHWDGSAWQVVTTPSVAQMSNALYAVSAVSANDVWAVGAYGAYDNRQTLIEHWDGTQWSTQGTSRSGALMGVIALSASKAWAVGYSGASFYRQTLIMRLTSTGWEVAPSPSPGSQDNILYDVAAIADDDIWAVGSFNNAYKADGAQKSPQGGGGYGADETLIEHWDGGRWTQIPSPNREYEQNYLYSIAVVSPTEMWAVGESTGYYGYGHTFAARYVGRAGFNDVSEYDYFYEAVRYLYCARAISGYADNTFRPYFNMTRAQLSKVTVLAQGWTVECPTSGHFSDVLPSNPFYCYIETAYAHGVLAGYSDGTFRPGNNITRAQLCKVIVLSEGWPIDTHGGPHFSDVQTTHPFYGYIETAYNRGVILGYSDGTFQPGNPATRGQISKIVYSAVISP